MEPNPSAYPALRFFDPLTQTRKTGETLPHWQQVHVTYFVTFRLADSLPASMLHEWKHERESWLAAHPEPWSPEMENEYHRLFSHRIDQWLDQGVGECLLADGGNAGIVSNAFAHFDRFRYLIHSWVIMPNHVHLLLSMEKSSDLGSDCELETIHCDQNPPSRWLPRSGLATQLLRPDHPGLGSFHECCAVYPQESREGEVE